jgi:hypothetical protein
MISDLPSVVSQLSPPMNIFLFDRKGHTSEGIGVLYRMYIYEMDWC